LPAAAGLCSLRRVPGPEDLLTFVSTRTAPAPVPLVPGVNEVRVEAYYSTSGTTVGSDTIRVTYD